jgi:hypothetical protein
VLPQAGGKLDGRRAKRSRLILKRRIVSGPSSQIPSAGHKELALTYLLMRLKGWA